MSRRIASPLLPLLLVAAIGGRASAEDAGPPIDPPESDGEIIREFLESKIRHRLPAQLSQVIDGVFAVYHLRGITTALPEMWRLIRDDEDLQALAANVAQQYIPRLDYSAYVGSLVESSRYAAAAFGVEADLAAPICRFIGGAFNGHAYNDKGGSGIAWDSRVTGCLPWGPFAFELGFISKRDVRMALAASPTTGAGRFDSQGFEMKIRGFRWRQAKWEIVAIPADVSFIDLAPAINDGRESANFTIDAAAMRFIRYGAGAGGSDRVVEAIPVRVLGNQDAVGDMISSTVVSFGAVAWQGARILPWFFIDGNAMFQQGRISSTLPGAPTKPVILTGSVDLAFHALLGGVHGVAEYNRGILPDDSFRLLAEDRGRLSATFQTQEASWSTDLFAAYTRTVLTPEGVPSRSAAATYGAKLGYGRVLFGPIYMTLRAEAARSFYANAGGDALARPDVELRAMAGVAASWSTVGK